MRKKAQIEINSRVVLYIAAAVLIILLLIFAVRTILSFREKQRQIAVKGFGDNIEFIVDTIGYEDVKKINFDVPLNTEEICVIDLGKRKELLKNPILKRFYPLVYASVEENVNKNLFFLKKNLITDSSYVKNICFTNPPYFFCTKTPKSKIDLYFEGKGNCTEIVGGENIPKAKIVSPRDDPITPQDETVFTATDTIQFDATGSSGPEGFLYIWEFDDGNKEQGNGLDKVIVQHEYDELGAYLVILRVRNSLGYEGMDYTIVTIVSNNVRNTIKYDDSTVFLAKYDRKSINLISQLIPISSWTGQGGTSNYHPLVVYEGAFNPDELLAIPGLAELPQPLDIKIYDSTTLTPDEYLSYWSSIEDVVAVDSSPANAEAITLASIYASVINAPLIIADENTIAGYPIGAGEKIDPFNDMNRVYAVGDVDQAVTDALTNRVTAKVKKYTVEELYSKTFNTALSYVFVP